MQINDSTFDTIIYKEVLPAISKAYSLYCDEFNHGNLTIGQSRADALNCALEKHTQRLMNALETYIKSECAIYKTMFLTSEQK